MDLDSRLHNWGRVVREKGRAQASVGSLEGQYRSPQRWNEDDAPMPVAPPLTGIQIADGWQVEAAWSTLALDRRTMLRSHYCDRQRPAVVNAILRRSTKMRVTDYACELAIARGLIAAALQRSQVENSSIARTFVRKVLDYLSKTDYNNA